MTDILTKGNVPSASQRLLSLDALRGFDMFWIVGAEEEARANAKRAAGESGTIGLVRALELEQISLSLPCNCGWRLAGCTYCQPPPSAR